MRDFVLKPSQPKNKTMQIVTWILALGAVAAAAMVGVNNLNPQQQAQATSNDQPQIDSLSIPPSNNPNAQVPESPEPINPTTEPQVELAAAENAPAESSVEPASNPPVTDASTEQTLVVEQPIAEVAVAQTGEDLATGQSQPEAEGEIAADEATLQPETADVLPQLTWKEHTIQAKENLAGIFKAEGFAPSVLHKIVNCAKTATELARVKPGEILKFGINQEGQLTELVWEKDAISSLTVKAEGDNYVAIDNSKPIEVRQGSATGLIETSLFNDGQKAGLSDGQIMEMASLFGWDIDFALELREGDTFSVLYEEHYVEGEKVRNGPILAAEFINNGKAYRAFRYTVDGSTDYYDNEGRAKRAAFLRTPVKFSRISSLFNPKRWHPLLQKWRAHRGVDYAAPTGTPVKAAGNGKITFVGNKDGFGKVIMLQHGSTYTTVYGHLSKFAGKLKTGSSVKQGDIIGYVGQTGLASGPHLHYEFRVNGAHRDPLTVTLPKSEPLPKDKLADFKAQTAKLVSELNNASAQTVVASSSNTTGDL